MVMIFSDSSQRDEFCLSFRQSCLQRRPSAPVVPVRAQPLASSLAGLPWSHLQHKWIAELERMHVSPDVAEGDEA